MNNIKPVGARLYFEAYSDADTDDVAQELLDMAGMTGLVCMVLLDSTYMEAYPHDSVASTLKGYYYRKDRPDE